MANFLEKFNSTVHTRQTEQILRILSKQKASGQIRTAEEFTQRLDSLVRELTSTTLKPTLKLFLAADQEISSEQYNFMLERVEDDLNTAFEEVNQISEVQTSHEAIIRDVVLKNLKNSLSELESKVDLYEFLNTNENNFSLSIFSTFKENKDSRLGRDNFNQTDDLFLDPRSGLPTSPGSQDAYVDLVGERLSLGLQTKNTFFPRKIEQIFDSETITSSEAIDHPDSSIEYMLDGESGTYWTQSVLVKDVYNSLITKLELFLSGTRTVNLVELTPAQVFPFLLKKIYYMDSSSVIRLLSEPNLLISSTTTCYFPSVSTSKIILEFESFTKKHASFQRLLNTSLLPLGGLPTNVPTVAKVYTSSSSSALTQQPSTPIGVAPAGISSFLSMPPPVQLPGSVIDALPAPSQIKENISGEVFEIGFDSIQVGSSSYSSSSIYVSKPLTVTNPAQVGLRTIESRPFGDPTSTNISNTNQAYNESDDVFFHCSNEFWVVKRDYDDGGNILSTQKIPILPMGVERINHERLILTERSGSSIFLPDVGYFMFLADPLVSNIQVYRNGESISDWTLITSPNEKTPGSGSKMRTKIQITNVLPGEIYTVSYTPVISSTISVPVELTEYSSSGISVVDLTGDLSARLTENQLILLSKNSDKIASSDIYMVIVIRNNSSNELLTSFVEEYALVIGEQSSDKYSGDNF